MGGWVRGQKKVCVPKIDLQVRAPLINFIFFLRKNFLMWVGGWVGGSAKIPGGQFDPPPPPVSLSKGLFQTHSIPLRPIHAQSPCCVVPVGSRGRSAVSACVVPARSRVSPHQSLCAAVPPTSSVTSGVSHSYAGQLREERF